LSHFEYYKLTFFLVHYRDSAGYNVSEVVTSRYLSAAVKTCYFTLRDHSSHISFRSHRHRVYHCSTRLLKVAAHVQYNSRNTSSMQQSRAYSFMLYQTHNCHF